MNEATKVKERGERMRKISERERFKILERKLRKNVTQKGTRSDLPEETDVGKEIKLSEDMDTFNELRLRVRVKTKGTKN